MEAQGWTGRQANWAGRQKCSPPSPALPEESWTNQIAWFGVLSQQYSSKNALFSMSWSVVTASHQEDMHIATLTPGILIECQLQKNTDYTLVDMQYWGHHSSKNRCCCCCCCHCFGGTEAAIQEQMLLKHHAVIVDLRLEYCKGPDHV